MNPLVTVYENKEPLISVVSSVAWADYKKVRKSDTEAHKMLNSLENNIRSSVNSPFDLCYKWGNVFLQLQLLQRNMELRDTNLSDVAARARAHGASLLPPCN